MPGFLPIDALALSPRPEPLRCGPATAQRFPASLAIEASERPEPPPCRSRSRSGAAYWVKVMRHSARCFGLRHSIPFAAISAFANVAESRRAIFPFVELYCGSRSDQGHARFAPDRRWPILWRGQRVTPPAEPRTISRRLPRFFHMNSQERAPRWRDVEVSPPLSEWRPDSARVATVRPRASWRSASKRRNGSAGREILTQGKIRARKPCASKVWD